MPLYDELHRRRDQIVAVAARNKLNRVRVFGSVARGEERPDSDVDFLVSPEPDASLLDLGGFLADMEEMLGRKVQVVTEKGVHWYIRDRVLSEARPL